MPVVNFSNKVTAGIATGRAARRAVFLAAALIAASPALAAGDVVGFRKYPVQTYDTYGDPDVSVTKEQLGDLSGIEISGAWKEKRLIVLALADTQIAVNASEIITRDPGLVAEILGTAPSKNAITCFGRPGALAARPSGAKTRTTKGFGGNFCP